MASNNGGIQNLPMPKQDAKIMVEKGLNLWSGPVFIPNYLQKVPKRVN